MIRLRMKRLEVVIGPELNENMEFDTATHMRQGAYLYCEARTRLHRRSDGRVWYGGSSIWRLKTAWLQSDEKKTYEGPRTLGEKMYTLDIEVGKYG